MASTVTHLRYGFSTTLDSAVEDAIPVVRAALQANGFGVLSEIDVAAALKEKLGVDVEPYVILGACNPTLAHRGLGLEPDLGLLLPCNVTVRRVEGHTLVSVIDAEAMIDVTGNPELKPMAEEANARLRAALTAL